FIDAVCISGGEPTLYEDLPEWIGRIKEKGFLIKLDTNGTKPKMLRTLLDQNLLDYVAMDVKAPWGKYGQVVGAEADVEAVRESVNILKGENRIEVEFRTTVCSEYLSLKDILEIAEELKGSRRYTIQNFRDTETVLAGAGKLHPYDKAELEIIGGRIKDWFEIFKIRG
ncbi:MAG TPA: anaerobic ribonucleoside-triphosphate reductase activating protein, partial [Clostridiales bacterium]|nr:anaerobic ribonucleoside-triphosphate reductase activating protein [Clostridiales bacterium]